jgi:hypothetical protein
MVQGGREMRERKGGGRERAFGFKAACLFFMNPKP